MKTASVRDLRNHYTGILRWIASGEVVQITRRGRAVARLVPEVPPQKTEVDWSMSSAIRRDRTRERKLTSRESNELIKEAGGKW
jgi:prevent-host-death family protein